MVFSTKITSSLLGLLFLIPIISAAPYHISLLSITENNNEGNVVDAYLTIKPGSGLVFIDSLPLAKLDTQISIRFAKQYACSISKYDCSKLDFFYVIRAPTTIIGGPSAGAALTVLTYAALEDLDINQKTTITGTINSGGYIGPVGGVTEKILAAQEHGFSRVLIPETTENVSYNPKLIKVNKVSNIEEAIYYFTNKNISTPVNQLVIPEDYSYNMERVSYNLCERANNMLKLVNASNQTREWLSKASIVASKRNYYSAGSFCFSAALLLRQQILSNMSNEELKKEFYELKKQVNEFEPWFNKDINSLADLEILMIVRERVLETIKAIDSINESNISASTLGYGIERFNSAIEWSSFRGSIKSPEYAVSEQLLHNNCQQKLSEAEERVNFLIASIGYELNNLQDEIDETYNYYNNNEYALCIFSAGKIKAKADSIITAVYTGSNLNKSIKKRLERVYSLLSNQQTKGRFPILAYSYYEYASNLEDDIYSANLYAEYALELSGLDAYFPSDNKKVKLDKEKITMILVSTTIGFIAGLLLRKKWTKK